MNFYGYHCPQDTINTVMQLGIQVPARETCFWPEMTFNDLEGQNHIAYSAIRPNMSMHAEYQVNPCSG